MPSLVKIEFVSSRSGGELFGKFPRIFTVLLSLVFSIGQGLTLTNLTQEYFVTSLIEFDVMVLWNIFNSCQCFFTLFHYCLRGTWLSLNKLESLILSRGCVLPSFAVNGLY